MFLASQGATPAAPVEFFQSGTRAHTVDRTFYFSTTHAVLPSLTSVVDAATKSVLQHYATALSATPRALKAHEKSDQKTTLAKSSTETSSFDKSIVAKALAPHLFDVLAPLGNRALANRTLPKAVQTILTTHGDAFREAICVQNPRFIADMEGEVKTLVPDLSGKSIKVLIDAPNSDLAKRTVAFMLRTSLLVMTPAQRLEVAMSLVENLFFEAADFAPLVDDKFFGIELKPVMQNVTIVPVDKSGRRIIFKVDGPQMMEFKYGHNLYVLRNTHIHPQREGEDLLDREYHFVEHGVKTVGEVHSVFEQIDPQSKQGKDQYLLMARPLAIKQNDNPNFAKALAAEPIDYAKTFLDVFADGKVSHFPLASLNNNSFDDMFPVLLSSAPLEISEAQFSACTFGKGNPLTVMLPMNPFANPLNKDRWLSVDPSNKAST